MKLTLQRLVPCLTLMLLGLLGLTGSLQAAMPGEYVITDYGAKGDAKFDNAPVFNALLSKMPAIGGVIRVPAGEFLIDSPLLIKSNNVTIQGVNRGWRSNVDAPVPDISGLGGGSKIIVGPGSAFGIQVPVRPRLGSGRANRLTGVCIRDLNICGTGSSRGQCGVDVEQDGDGVVIDNISCINLGQGIVLKAADASRISDCLIAECRTCLSVAYSIQTMVANCDLGAQPLGVTCLFSGDNQLIMTGCDVFPDGASAVKLQQCNYATISDCLISGWYTGLVEIDGSHNALIADAISAIDRGDGWPLDPSGRDGSWGLIRLSGDDNTLLSCTIDSKQPVNDTRVHCVSGARITLSDLNLSGNASNRKVVLDDAAVDARVVNCATAAEIQSPRDVPETIQAIPAMSVQQ